VSSELNYGGKGWFFVWRWLGYGVMDRDYLDYGMALGSCSEGFGLGIIGPGVMQLRSQ
jgi:hypothetical protein